MQRIAARLVCWAFAVRFVDVLTVDDRTEFLVITLPWHVQGVKAKELAHDISERTGLQVICLPEGATLARLRSTGRVTDVVATGNQL